jgi:predicted transcriptional regulator
MEIVIIKMPEYICKQFNLNSLIKCCFNLAESEIKVFLELMECKNPTCVLDISKKLKRDRSTVQKIMHSLLEKGLVEKKKFNLEEGGYIFYYSPKSKSEIKKQMLQSVEVWHSSMKKSIIKW